MVLGQAELLWPRHLHAPEPRTGKNKANTWNRGYVVQGKLAAPCRYFKRRGDRS